MLNSNGERRTTVSVRFSDEDLAELDELAQALHRQRCAEAAEFQRRWIERKPPTRSEALRRAIEIAMEHVA